METHQRHREPAAREPHALGHVRDDPDSCVGLFVAGHQEHALVGADVDRQRHRHAREHHRIVQRNDSEPVHSDTMVGLITLVCQLFI